MNSINKKYFLIITGLCVLARFELIVQGLPQSYSKRQQYSDSDNEPNSHYNPLTEKPENRIKRRSDDDYNAKFLGAGNQEVDYDDQDTGRTFHRHKHRFHYHHRPHYSHGGGGGGGPCRRRGRRQTPDEEGKFLWDLNIYNIYPKPNQQQYDSNNNNNNNRPQNDCDDSGGGGGGGIFYDDGRPPSRPFFSIPIFRPLSDYNNNNRPSNDYNNNNNNRPSNDYNNNNRPWNNNNNNRPSNNNNYNNNNNNRPQNQPGSDVHDPVIDDRPVNEHIPDDNPPPMQTYLTTGQTVGGIASTVNSVIQTLTTGNRPARAQAAQYDSAGQGASLTFTPGELLGGFANTVNSVIQTLSGNGQNGAFLNSLYSGFNLF